MQITKARKIFKNKFCQANHFLITSLVWVDWIKEWIITKKSDSFSTSWNPRNKVQSAIRTRSFLLELFLWKAVDSLEVYLKLLYRKPNLYFSNKEIVD